jgi:uroporphyrinogen-III synthase
MTQKMVLVIRGDEKFSSALRDAGLNVINLELIKTEPREDLSELRRVLAKLSRYDGIFFTSPVAAEIFVRELNGSSGFSGTVHALGERAQSLLRAAGLSLKTNSADTAEELLDLIDDTQLTGKKFLFVRGERSLRVIPERLSGLADIDELIVYRTEPKAIDKASLARVKGKILEGEIDRVCFFSPSGVERFAELFGEAAKLLTAAVIGTTTADAARRHDLIVDFISPRSNAEIFAYALIDHLKRI